MAIISTKPNKSNVSIKERNIDETSESFSSPLVNFIEPNEIGGTRYTRFFTRVDTNLKVGDKVFIVNGNYDSFDLISNYEYSPGSTGYNILEIETTSITLDIEWVDNMLMPWSEEPFDNYIKIYGCENTQETQYEVLQSKYYPYKYIYGYRGNNNILFCSTVNEFRVADSSNYSNFSNWFDISNNLMNNNFPTINGNNITPNNGKLLIMSTFTYNNQTFEKGYIYEYDDSKNKWVKNIKQRQAFLSQSNFRGGVFNGTFNDGIFGIADTKNVWSSSEWNGGILFNSIWSSGVMNSKSDNINKSNHYASLEDGSIKQITDFNNNDGFGYNFAFDSEFIGGTIRNVNANNCKVGEYTHPETLVDRYLLNPDDDFNFDCQLGGRWVNSKIENSNIDSGLYEFSEINSSLSRNGRFSDTDIKYSITAGSMEGLGKINIQRHERLFTANQYIGEDPFNLAPFTNNDSLIINHKFYISERDYTRIKSGSHISLNNLVTSSSDILNFFDNTFYLGVDKNGDIYISDNYGNNTGVSVQLKSREQNRMKRVLTNNQFPLQEITNSTNLPSLDLFIHLPSIIDLNSDLNGFLNGSLFDRNYRQRISDINETTLQIGKFEKSIFNGGTWEATKVNNPDYQIERIGSNGEFLNCSFSNNTLIVNLNDFTNILTDDQLVIGDIIYLSNISYDLSGTILPIDGTYKLKSYVSTPNLRLTLEDFGSQSIASSYQSGGDFISSFIVDTDGNGNKTYDLSEAQESFLSVHLEKIENTTIKSGLLKRELLIGTMFENDDFIQQTELDIRNVNLLKISEVSLSEVSNVEAKSGLFIRCFIKDNIWNNGIIYRSLVKDLTILGGVVKESKWIRGNFNGGIFLGTKRRLISDISDNSRIFTNISIEDEWLDGNFNGGEFFDSIWTTGEFNGGKFYNSIFAAGNFNGGRFGDSSFPNSANKFGDAVESHRSVNILGNNSPQWYNGTFNKGEFGLRNNNNLTISPLLDNINWYDGIFNDGTIVSYSPDSSVIWHDGTFDNGDIIGYVQWKDGTFNSGKFRSAWGSGYGLSASNYAWEDGIFNGGRFGESDGVISVRLNEQTTYRNPSWFDGRFNDGQFMGKVWHDGTFTGGRFIGNSDSSYFSTRNRETFPNSFRINPFVLTNLFLGDLGDWKIGDILFFNVSISGDPYIRIEPSSFFIGSSDLYSIQFRPIQGLFTFSNTITSIYNGERYGLISPILEYKVNAITLSYEIYLETTPPSSWDSSDYLEVIVDVYVTGEDQQRNIVQFNLEKISLSASTNSPILERSGVLNIEASSNSVSNIELVDGGSNHDESTTQTITIFSGGTVTVASINNPGTGYTTGTKSTTGGNGEGLILDIIAQENDGGVVSFDLSNLPISNGYTTNDTNVSTTTVTGSGTGLTVDLTSDGNQVTNVVVNSIGSGYNIGDEIEIDGEGDPFTLTIDDVRNGKILSFTINDGGYGYSVTGLAIDGSNQIIGGDNNATALVTEVSDPSSGSGLEVDIITDNGIVTEVIIIDGGINYEVGDILFISTFDSVPAKIEVTEVSDQELFSDMEYKISMDFTFDFKSGPSTNNSEWQDAYVKIDDIDFQGIEREKISSIPDQFVMDYSSESLVNFYGMWRNGEVISDNTVAVGESNFIKLSKLESVKRFKGESNPKIFFENALWVNGEFKAFGQMDNCVWLSGSFRNGRFLNSAFNPYVPRWDFSLDVDDNNNNINEKYSFDLTDNCVWKSGYLDNSEFSISVWENGTFNNGTMFGSLFKNGIVNYMNAENCIWENGLWQNGNWYGSNFEKNFLFRPVEDNNTIINDLFSFRQSKLTDSIISNSKRLSNDDMFVWSLVDTRDEDIYSSNLGYEYWDINGDSISGPLSQSLSMSNNDFSTVGNFSQITDISDSDLGNPAIARSLNLNFTDKDSSGYQIGWTSSENQTGVLDFRVNGNGNNNTGDYPIDVNLDDGIVSSSWGNGVFMKGRWLNGVWNNGPRLNETFDTVSSITFLDNVNNFFENGINRWQIDLSSDENIPSNFNVGDYISIGNIIALTINDNRKLLNDSYQIIRLDRNSNSLSIIVKVTFPIKSIEKDSINHRIMVTNNVWESGTFHNGRFEGVWNHGNFEGYPNITTLENTHFIDGTLDGGKMISNPNYIDSLGRSFNDSLIQNATINIRNNDDPTLSETVLDIIYKGDDPDEDEDPIYSHIWSSGLPQPIQTSDDVLSSTTKIVINNRERNLNLGVKFKKYGDLIQDDLEGITTPETLESRGWSFSVVDGSSTVVLPSGQQKFLGHLSNSPNIPSDNMVIDTFKGPTASPFGDGSTYLISHENLDNIIINRYWEVSYTIVEKDFGNLSGTNSYINPHPYPLNDRYKFEEEVEIKTYHWNFPKNSPFIILANGVVAKIGDIKFTEVDYIPIPDITGLSPNINPDNSLKIPKSSISPTQEFSEDDATFIDNKKGS